MFSLAALPGGRSPGGRGDTRANDDKTKPGRIIEPSGKRIALQRTRNTVVELPTAPHGHSREIYDPSADEHRGGIAEACFLLLFGTSDVQA